MRLKIALTTLALALVVSACSGGGGASAPSGVSEAPAAPPPLMGAAPTNRWTAFGPYAASSSPFRHSAGICYAGPTSGRTVQADLDLLTGTDGFRMLHLYHLYLDDALTMDPNMLAVLNYAAQASPKLEILLGTLNSHVTNLFQTRAGADTFVNATAPYLRTGVIQAIALGNEPNDRKQANIAPGVFSVAAGNLRASLDAAGFQDVPITVCLLYGGIVSYPPAQAHFQETGDIYSMEGYARALAGLSGKPFVFVNLFPHFAVTSVVAQFPQTASWYPQFGLFTSTADPASQDGNLAPYWDLLDLQYNTVTLSLGKAGLGNVQVYVSETGWPSDGGGTYTTVANEAAFVNGLLDRWVGPQRSTASPSVPTFLFSAFDNPDGAGVEGHWGLRDTSGNLKAGIALPAWLSE